MKSFKVEIVRYLPGNQGKEIVYRIIKADSVDDACIKMNDQCDTVEYVVNAEEIK